MSLSFLYPALHATRHAGYGGRRAITAAAYTATRPTAATPCHPVPRQHYSTEHNVHAEQDLREADIPVSNAARYPVSHLNPTPDDYAATTFADKATLTVHAGVGGAGCVSFLRDLFIPDGPPNGGDGGHGGNVYIQAVPGETSLHKIARRRVMRAGRGKHGMGSARNGTRGDDLIVTVPVGTIITEVSRVDPLVDDTIIARERYHAQKRKRKLARAAEEAAKLAPPTDEPVPEDTQKHKSKEQLQLEQRQQQEAEEDDAAEAEWLRRKWVIYPGLSAAEVKNVDFPRLPRRDRFHVQPAAPIYLDLSRPTPQPILLATGGIGGLGNPHFMSRRLPRPYVATRGENAVSLTVSMELKLLADVGLVGLPNAGKSTLLRAVSNSRARVGSWAFTTLQPNIGTVVLDNNKGRPLVAMRPVQKHQRRETQLASEGGEDDADTVAVPPRTRFTVADIPGLIEGAHLDKGLGIEFLRHVERAGVLAFVIDLSAGDAVSALKALWKEVGLYARLRAEEEEQREREARIEWKPDDDPVQSSSYTAVDTYGTDANSSKEFPELAIAGKPWFVVANKGDLPGAETNFQRLNDYIERISQGAEEHPSGVQGGWTKNLAAIPISAINGHGVDRIVHWTVGLLDL
ncbi:GTPase of the mitochondrial inner membrane that associates with the large ribosomal subunit [Sporothrix epigloea]|uniref:GTPase of the mitochondrial inner membrane that associates with the large ribosomal subunit n=1 Tax=Sporothrix epigloea TaxID=1892477 RepID=A0ABP0D7L8_9PEZI